jgi:hypothetical protein
MLEGNTHRIGNFVRQFVQETPTHSSGWPSPDRSYFVDILEVLATWTQQRTSEDVPKGLNGRNSYDRRICRNCYGRWASEGREVPFG